MSQIWLISDTHFLAPEYLLLCRRQRAPDTGAL